MMHLRAGILALVEMSRRLAEDHSNAQYLAQELSKTPHVEINLDLVSKACVQAGQQSAPAVAVFTGP